MVIITVSWNHANARLSPTPEAERMTEVIQLYGVDEREFNQSPKWGFVLKKLKQKGYSIPYLNQLALRLESITHLPDDFYESGEEELLQVYVEPEES